MTSGMHCFLRAGGLEGKEDLTLATGRSLGLTNGSPLPKTRAENQFRIIRNWYPGPRRLDVSGPHGPLVSAPFSESERENSRIIGPSRALPRRGRLSGGAKRAK